MAKAKTISGDRNITLVEALVTLQNRGRSVVNGTVLVGDSVRTFKHELSDAEKRQFVELISSALADSWLV